MPSKAYSTDSVPLASFKTDNIEALINEHLSGFQSKQVIVSGNFSVASQVSQHHDVIYVDNAKKNSQIEQSSQTGIRRVVKSDVLDFIFFNAAPCLVISSATTSEWLHRFQLDRLTKAVERNRYSRVFLDFVDAAKVPLDNTIAKKTDSLSGCHIVSVKDNSASKPLEKYSAFDKKALVDYLTKALPKYQVLVFEGSEAEQSIFTLSLSKKASLSH